RNAAIHVTAAGPKVIRQCPPVRPDRAPCLRVEGDNVARGIRDVHDTIEHERRCFKMMPSVHLVHPYRLQLLNVRAVDLVEGGIALTVVRSVIGQPAAWLGCGLADSVVGKLRRKRHREKDGEGTGDQSPHCAPSRETRYATRSSSAPPSRRPRKLGI